MRAATPPLEEGNTGTFGFFKTAQFTPAYKILHNGKITALDPKYPEAHLGLGNVLELKGDLDGAIACFNEALRLDPTLAPAKRNLDRVRPKHYSEKDQERDHG